MKINAAGLDIIKRFEGLRLEAYRCPAGVWTIGYGHTGDVKEGDKITEHQADAVLDVDLDRFERGVYRLTRLLGTNENEFSALVSFAFNVGVKAFEMSTLMSRFREGKSPQLIADEFLKWTRGGGKVLPGLVKRREAERALFLTPVPK